MSNAFLNLFFFFHYFLYIFFLIKIFRPICLGIHQEYFACMVFKNYFKKHLDSLRSSLNRQKKSDLINLKHHVL